MAWDIIGAKYIASAVKFTQYPETKLNEVAFIGRSNVGKSSLINSLARCKKLARVSSAPGKTQTINFYEVKLKEQKAEEPRREEFYFVDLPGYGFAKTGKSNREQWSEFIGKYLENSEQLQVVCQLIDIRHAPLESDVTCHQWLRQCGREVLVVLTKADKLSKNAVASQQALFRRELGLRPEQIMAYSAVQHNMRAELISRLEKYVLPQA